MSKMSNLAIEEKIRQIDFLLKLKEKAETLKLESLIFTEEKKAEMVQAAELINLEEEVASIIDTNLEIVNSIYNKVKKLVDRDLELLIN